MAAAILKPLEEERDLPTELIRYVNALSEPISIYNRYMDALLIKRADHPAFFRDLKAFRCQKNAMALLTTPASPSFDSKETFLAVTRLFLTSRFAHPWCQTSQLKEGWSTAKLGGTKKQSEARQREEQRLHKLLVPIWCGFRVRMKPSGDVLAKWLDAESQRDAEKPVSSDARTGRPLDGAETVPLSTSSSTPTLPVRQDTVSRPDRSTTVNAEAYCMELDEEEVGETPNHSDAAAAAKLFVGVAATGFLGSNKRARKYLLKKLNKKT